MTHTDVSSETEDKTSVSAESEPKARAKRSRSHRRKTEPKLGSRHLITCWFGRACERKECWFKHPDGRDVDRKREKRDRSRVRSRPIRSRTPLRSPRRVNRSASKPREKSRREGTKHLKTSEKNGREEKEEKEKDEKKNEKKKKVETKDTEEEQSDQAKDAANVTGSTSSALKKMDFREFILQHFEGTPEEAVAAFQAYCQKMTEEEGKTEFEILKNTGLCFDLYHPLGRLRSYDWSRSMACERAKNFLMEVEQGRYTGLSLRARRPNGASVTCPVAHLEPPEFAFDANVGTLMISGLPPAMSAWDVVEALQDLSGFTSAAWTPPSPQKLSRSFYAHFKSAKEAHAALLALLADPDLLRKGLTTGTARASLQEGSPELSALVLPSVMSSPSRLEKDLLLSKSVIERMDELHGVSKEITSSLLDFCGNTELKLDLQVLYLRRVHHFCFYSGKWCRDEWTLRILCGAATVREPYRQDDTDMEIWAIGHEGRIKDFLDTVSLTRPTVLRYDDVQIKERFDEVCREKIITVSDQKFQCKDCRKSFKGCEYVRNHLLRMHTDILQGIREEFHQNMARKEFLADPERPPLGALRH